MHGIASIEQHGQHPYFSGGLPDGWLSTANTFRKLKFLDLAENKLGFAADGSTPLTAEQWCPAGRTGDSGWCPATVNKARAPVLEILDVSENGLTGKLVYTACY